MLAYNLGITKRDNKRMLNRGRFWGLQIGTRGIANRNTLRDFESGKRDFILGQGLQIRAREITNPGRDFKLGQGL